MHIASQECKRLLHYGPRYAFCMSSPNQRLKQAREAAGFATAKDAAEAMGMPVSTYIGHENGHRGFPAKTAPQYARKFKVSEEWLLFGKGAEASDIADPAIPAHPIPVIGEVAAGNWREAVRRSSLSIPSPDPSMPSDAFALEVSGDSMDLLVDDGAMIIVSPSDRSLFHGRYYVVENGEGETTFKRYMDAPARLVPCSSNPAHKEIPLGEAEVRIIGRIIWRSTRM